MLVTVNIPNMQAAKPEPFRVYNLLLHRWPLARAIPIVEADFAVRPLSGPKWFKRLNNLLLVFIYTYSYIYDIHITR